MASRRSWCILALGSPNRKQNGRLLRTVWWTALILYRISTGCAFLSTRSTHRYNMATSSSIERLWARGLTRIHNIARLRSAVKSRSVQDRKVNTPSVCTASAVLWFDGSVFNRCGGNIPILYLSKSTTLYKNSVTNNSPALKTLLR